MEENKIELLKYQLAQLGNALHYINGFYNETMDILSKLENNTTDVGESVDDYDVDEDDELSDDELIRLHNNGDISGFIGSVKDLGK